MNLKSITTNKWFLAALFFLIYSILLNWKFAIVLMISIAFHETGHLLAAKKQGLRVGGFYFVPFMGGVAIIKDHYRTYGQQAYVAIMGPISGCFLAGLFMIAGAITHNSFCTITASWMAVFNLFNLIPVTFLDGGQILKTISLTVSKKYGFLIINIVTIIVGSTIFYFLKSPIIILVMVWSLYQNYIESKSSYSLPKNLSKKHIVYVIGSYLLTAISLLLVLLISLNYTKYLIGEYSIWIK